jgi:hypothetical protein
VKGLTEVEPAEVDSTELAANVPATEGTKLKKSSKLVPETATFMAAVSEVPRPMLGPPAAPAAEIGIVAAPEGSADAPSRATATALERNRLFIILISRSRPTAGQR